MKQLPKLTAENLPSVRKYLPDTFLDIETITDTKTALLLANSILCGTQCRVAQGKTAKGRETNAELAALIGVKHAERLASVHSGLRSFFIPECRKAREILRNREILATFDRMTGQGETVYETTRKLAVQYGISQRRIYLIAKTTAE